MKRVRYQLSEEQLKKLKLSDEEISALKQKGQKTMFENILNSGVRSVYKNGIGGKLQRTFGRVLDKLDSDGEGCLNLEEAEFEFVQEVICSENSRFDVGTTRLVLMYEKALKEAEQLPS